MAMDCGVIELGPSASGNVTPPVALLFFSSTLFVVLLDELDPELKATSIAAIVASDTFPAAVPWLGLACPATDVGSSNVPTPMT